MIDGPLPPGAALFDGAAAVASPSNVHAFPGAGAAARRPALSIVSPGPEAAAARARPPGPPPIGDNRGPPLDDGGGPPPPSDGGASFETLAECAKLEQNDTDNGRRLLLHFGDEMQHVREIGWHAWTGQLWRRPGGDERVTALAQRTAKLIHQEVAMIEHLPAELETIRAAEGARQREKKQRSEAEHALVAAAEEAESALKGRRRSLHKHATTSGNGGRISAMIAQALPHKSADPSELDADHMLFNVENGTLRFSKVLDEDNISDHKDNFKLKVELLEHDRAHLITKIAPIVYDPKATAPKFMAFMERFQPKPEVRKFLQVYTGLSLTGETGQQCFLYLHGTGANGKSTYMEAMAALFGGYSDLLNAESLTGTGQRRGDQATPDFAELPGVRYLRVSELPRGEPLKEALVKALTGGEEIKARHLNKGFFKYSPVFKATMSGNDLPSIGGVDNGIWRRVRLVPWEVTIPDGERRPMNEVLAEFAAERSGILNWLIEGLDLFMREGLETPSDVTMATKEYRSEMDPIAAFAESCLAPCDGHFETARNVYLAFESWCLANSIRPWKETAFGRAMPHKGFVRENGRVRRYLNVKLHDVPPREEVGGRLKGQVDD